MESLKLIDRKARYIAAAAALMLATVIPALAMAAQVTERSIELSSASVGATGVTYKVSFTATGAAEAFVLDFCSNTPLYGEDCTAPTNFSLSSGPATSITTGYTDESVLDANTIRVTSTLDADEDVVAEIAGVRNPNVAGPLYARIVTFDTAGHADAYVSNPVEPAVNTGMVDEGGVAMSITPTIGVSGAVLETMTFCVSGETIADDCVGGGTAAPALTAPTLRLGNNVGGVIALDSQDVYEGTIYTQISTNASKGAIVSLKSSATGCGGLIRSSDTAACNILPAGTTGTIAEGEAKFGLKLGADVTDATDGDFVAASATYDSTNFRLNYVSNNTAGVTGPYGDPILDTNTKPANNRLMPLTFGASVTNNTPAGNYSADLSLIATGKF
mgnify:FL=1